MRRADLRGVAVPILRAALCNVQVHEGRCGNSCCAWQSTKRHEGVITVEEAKSLETELDVVEGMQFDRGYVSPYFVTNAEKMCRQI